MGANKDPIWVPYRLLAGMLLLLLLLLLMMFCLGQTLAT